MLFRPLFAVAFTLALVAPAMAQSPAASERMNAGPLGSVAMAREAAPGADGAATVSARVLLNASAAVSAGARHVLLGVGNDAAPSLVVRIESVTDKSGNAVAASAVEAQGTYRAQWWLDPTKLPATAELVVTASAKPGATAVDVETLVMAFDAGYRALNASDGRPLTLQSFTRVAAAPTPPTGEVPPTNNGTNNTFEPPPGNGSTDDDEQESRGLPAPGAAVAALAVGAAALVAARRRR